MDIKLTAEDIFEHILYSRVTILIGDVKYSGDTKAYDLHGSDKGLSELVHDAIGMPDDLDFLFDQEYDDYGRLARPLLKDKVQRQVNDGPFQVGHGSNSKVALISVVPLLCLGHEFYQLHPAEDV